MKINAMLMTDFYKVSHRLMSEEGTESIYSTFTPRRSRIENINSVTFFGLQGLIQSYLLEYFDENFFKISKDKIVSDYKRVIRYTLGESCATTDHIEKLHDLGYLPIKIKALKEGTQVPMSVPVFTIENTIPEFYWLTNFLETSISAEIWKTITATTIAREYFKISNKWSDKTCDDKSHIIWQNHNFSFRGMANNQDATTTGAGHLLYSCGTDTIPSIVYLEQYYGANIEKELVGASVLATEHSIQCQYADDKRYYERMIKEVAPNGIISIVSDGYDYWNVLTDVLPQLKQDILNRDGKLVVRPDSGDPVKIICGTLGKIEDYTDECETKEELINYMSEILIDEIREETPHGEHGSCENSKIIKWKDKYYGASISNISWNRHDKQYYYIDMWEKPNTKIEEIKLSPEQKGSIEVLWDLFGGTVNEKGYKVLDSHIGLIYGDSITLDRAEEIFKQLESKGFASSNVVFGVGSYSLGYVTRDTFSFALKATYTKVKGEERLIFKDPKTDDGTKKSQKGKVAVVKLPNNTFGLIDSLYNDDEKNIKDNLLELVFEDGKLLRFQSLSEIRDIAQHF